MTTEDLIADLRGRINPAYAATLGTESYERRLCVEALEAQRARLDVLEREHAEFFERWHAERRRREALELIADAARHLVAQKGRHHTEQAYKKLEAALKTLNAKVRGPEAALSPEAPSRLTGYAGDVK